MRVQSTERRPEAIQADVLVVLFRTPRRGRCEPPLIEHCRPGASKLIARQAEATTWLETRELAAPRVLLYCLGPEQARWDPTLEYLGGHAGSYDRDGAALTLRQGLRNAGAAIERACNRAEVRHAVLAAWPDDCDPTAIVEGALLRAHDPRAWEAGGDGSDSTLRRITVCAPEDRERLRECVTIARATNFARTLGDLPGNLGTASAIVERVRAAIAERDLEHLRLSTISADRARELGMGLFAAVDAGAGERGCVLRLDYAKTGEAGETEPLLALLGKGMTHDTGGYNLKTSGTVHELTHDKCGAMAVIGAMLAIAELELPLRVTALCPMTENCVDAKAYKPGDILTALDGTTVYIENTDAEGRLILADALAWLGEHEPRPDLAIDLATLTGTIHAALGESFAGLYCNEDRAREWMLAAGRESGDLLWSMPIHEAHERDLGHHKADLRNVGSAGGVPSTAAAFLRHFVDYPWAHVDLAGKAHSDYGRGCYGPGATGFGTRLLVALARRFAVETGA